MVGTRDYQITLLKENGSRKKITFSTRPTFKDFYPLLNCDLIEIVHGFEDRKAKMILIDEEGRFKKDAKVNPNATKLFVNWLQETKRITQIPNIIGHAIVLDNFRLV